MREPPGDAGAERGRGGKEGKERASVGGQGRRFTDGAPTKRSVFKNVTEKRVCLAGAARCQDARRRSAADWGVGAAGVTSEPVVL